MEWILHHESKVRNLEGPDMCHVELPPEFYSLINGPNSVTILCCYHLNKLQTFMSIKSLNQIRQDNLNLNFWLVVSQFSFLRFFVSFHKNIPGLGGPVVVANRSKANGGSDDPWRYNWNSHGCSSWRPTDQQFSRKNSQQQLSMAVYPTWEKQNGMWKKLSRLKRQYTSATDGNSAGFVRLPEWIVPLGVWKMNAVNDFGRVSQYHHFWKQLSLLQHKVEEL